MQTEEFNELCKKSFALQKTIAQIEREEIDPLKEELRTIDGKIIEELQSLGVNSFKSGGGTVSLVTRYSVRTPKEPEDKEALFEYLRSKGDDVYYHYVSVNSQSLQSFYKAELEQAKEAGDFDFKVPGVGEPVASVTLQRRAGK